MASIEHRNIGSLEVTTVGLGCNNFGWHMGEEASREVVVAALDAGINHFDTADVYGNTESEEMLGRALGGRRDEVVIATKFGMKIDEQRQGAKPDYVRRAAEDSLRRLNTDRIDLYYLHKPDETTPIADTLGALNELVEAGKVREIACSNFSPTQLREAEKAAGSGARFVAVQNEFSLLHREPEKGTLETCKELGIGFVPYFPLKSGLLTGKYRKDQVPEGSRLSGQPGSFFQGMGESLLTEANLDTVERLIEFAEGQGHTILELAFAWLLAHEPVVSVIAGATKPSQIEQNVNAARWQLSESDMKEVRAILEHSPA